MASFKEQSRLPKPAMKSHYISAGPEFSCMLFNLGGQSPLISYYLTMHRQYGTTKTKQTNIKLTEISRQPTPPAPTYHDIIKEAKEQFSRNQKDFWIEKTRINEDIKLLKQRQAKIDKTIKRLQEKATRKPFSVKLEFDKFLNQLHYEDRVGRDFIASLASSSSTEDHNSEAEEP